MELCFKPRLCRDVLATVSQHSGTTDCNLIQDFPWVWMKHSLKLLVVKNSGKITGKSFPKLFTGGSKIAVFTFGSF